MSVVDDFGYAVSMGEHTVDIDETEWPIVRITYPKVLGTGSIADYVAHLEALGRRGMPYWALVDMRKMEITKIKPSHRTDLAAAVDDLNRRFPDIVRCEAVIHDSPVARMMHTAHLWVRKELPYPSKIFPTEADARAWIAELRND